MRQLHIDDKIMTEEEKVLSVGYMLENGRQCFWSIDCKQEATYLLFFNRVWSVKGYIEVALYCEKHYMRALRWAYRAYDISISNCNKIVKSRE